MVQRQLACCVVFGIALSCVLAAQSLRCDRACLEGLVDQYMDALVAHDSSKLSVARGVRNTENGQRLELGDGLWNTATGKGSYRLFVTDVAAGQVAFMGTMKEADVPVAVAIRLKVVNRQVAEIETFVVRGGLNNTKAGAELEKLGKPNELFTTEIAPADRTTREELIKVANMYFSGLEKNDGKGLYPFAEDCDRLEDGVRTTNNPDFRTGSGFGGGQASPINPATMSCKEAFESGYFNFVTRIRDRRYVAAAVQCSASFSSTTRLASIVRSSWRTGATSRPDRPVLGLGKSLRYSASKKERSGAWRRCSRRWHTECCRAGAIGRKGCRVDPDDSRRGI